jgi:hypothetical protein
MDSIRTQAAEAALGQGRELSADMLSSTDHPSDEDCHAPVANLQFPAMRDRLIADVPGVDEPIQQILFAQIKKAEMVTHRVGSTTPLARLHSHLPCRGR